MQWSPEPNAGFTTGTPWLPIADDYPTVNVEVQRNDPRSMLTLYKSLIELRRGEPALEIGRFRLHLAAGKVLSYLRLARAGETEFLVALNMGDSDEKVPLPADVTRGIIAVSTHLDRDDEEIVSELRLRPHEGVVMRIDVS